MNDEGLADAKAANPFRLPLPYLIAGEAAAGSISPTIESTWACACRTPFRSRSRRAPGRPRVRGPRDRAARERVLGCSRSPLPVVREKVISCLHDRVAREPALGVVP